MKLQSQKEKKKKKTNNKIKNQTLETISSETARGVLQCLQL